MTGQLESEIPRGWRQSMNGKSLHKRKGGWLAVADIDHAGYRVWMRHDGLRKTRRIQAIFLEDALAEADEVMG